MKRAALFIVAAAALTACDRTPTTPSSARSVVPTFSAVATNTNFTMPIDLLVFVPCANGGAGELIEVVGPLHVLSQLTISNTGRLLVYDHFQPQGISGTGFVTGAKYQGTGITQFKNTFGGPFPITFTFVNNFYMIGQGPKNNFKVHETFHFTINANGEQTALVDNFRVTCQ